MATCAYCGQGGFFRKVDANGLCADCAPGVTAEIAAIGESIVLHTESVANAKRIPGKLACIERAIKACEQLLPFEQKGIRPTHASAAALIEELRSQRAGLVADYIHERWHVARAKAQDAATDAGRLSGYANAIEDITEIGESIEDASIIGTAITEMRAERDKLRFLLISKKVAKAEAKGQNKKAIDLLIDAIVELRNDSTPDAEQLDLIERARAKIVALGGEPPAI